MEEDIENVLVAFNEHKMRLDEKKKAEEKSKRENLAEVGRQGEKKINTDIKPALEALKEVVQRNGHTFEIGEPSNPHVQIKTIRFSYHPNEAVVSSSYRLHVEFLVGLETSHDFITVKVTPMSFDGKTVSDRSSRYSFKEVDQDLVKSIARDEIKSALEICQKRSET